MSRTPVFHRPTPSVAVPRIERSLIEWLRTQFPEASPRPSGPHGDSFPLLEEVWYAAGQRAAVRLLENVLEQQENPGHVSQNAQVETSRSTQ
jgi:hypothetical protein